MSTLGTLRIEDCSTDAEAAHSLGITPREWRDAQNARNEVVSEEGAKQRGATDERISGNFPEHWKLSTMQEILTRPSVAPKWLIQDLLLEQSATLVSGHPHSGKSLNWLSAAIESVTTGKVWGHFQCAPLKRVLFVETEDAAVLVETRVRQLAKGLNLSASVPNGFHLATTGPFDLAQSEKQLEALIDEVKPEWMVLSTLQGLLGGRDWKEQRDMGPINAIFVKLARKCPIVVITHSPWNPEAKRAAGSVTQAANFLTLVHFEKQIVNNETLTTVTVDGKLGNEVPTFKLALETEGAELRRISYRHASQQERLLAFYRSNLAATAKEAAAAVGCTERYAREVKSAHSSDKKIQ